MTAKDDIVAPGFDLPRDFMVDRADETDAAFQSMHAMAHNGPKDSLYVENCRREPCRDIA